MIVWTRTHNLFTYKQISALVIDPVVQCYHASMNNLRNILTIMGDLAITKKVQEIKMIN